MEWHFDVLILWALAFTGEVAKAEDLLKGLKSRLERFFCFLCDIFKCGCFIAVILLCVDFP